MIFICLLSEHCLNMDLLGNDTDLHLPEHVTTNDDIHLELYSIVLSVTMLVLAILFGGGGCVTVLIAMSFHRLLRKLRYILTGILLIICSVFDLIWCPIEITRLLLHHQNVANSNKVVSLDVIRNMKYISSTLYVLLLCALAAMIVLICVQNLLKTLMKYERIPKLKLAISFLLIWILISVALTIGYILVMLSEEEVNVYHNMNKEAFRFKMAVQILWIVLVVVFISILAFLYVRKTIKGHLNTENSDLHSNENFTVPSLIIKSVEEIDKEENEESSIALPSPDIQRETGNESPVSRTSKSAFKKRSGSPSSQKVLFADTPSPTRDNPSPKFGERLKSQNHLEVNMAAILGRRRHTIAQISDPQFDMMQKAKAYNYVRKFSVDISALQAQLENPKINNNFPFHSQQDIKNSENNGSNRKLNAFGSQKNCNRRSRDEIIKSQEIAEEPEEHDVDNDHNTNNAAADVTETQSIHSQCASLRSMHSARDSMCPTPPLISLTQSDGEEKQLEVVSCDNNDSYPSSHNMSRLDNPCKLSCLLLITFLLSILPMFITEALWDICLSDKAYVNIDTCMIAFSVAQKMIFPQVIFCVDVHINKAVHVSFVRARIAILGFLHRKQHVPANDDISDTEV